MVYRSLLHLPVDVRSICMSRIVFVGGGTLIPGLRKRVLDEVANLIDEQKWDPVRGKAVDQYRSNPKLQRTKPRQPGPTEILEAQGVMETPIPSAALVEQEHDPIEEQLKKEAAKMSGLPVLQVTRVGVTADGQPLPPPSVAALPASQNHGSTTGAVGQEVATGTATQEAGSQISRLGTFGRALSSSSMGALMHHAPSPGSTPSQAPAAASATDGVLLESQTQTSGFSQAPVDANIFQIPPGYKAVASPMDHK